MVLSLADSLLDMGYCITTNNYYTSPQLADFLISKKTDLYGTQQCSNRKDLPREFVTKKILKGESLALQRNKVMVMKWHDKKEICLLSTIHNPEQMLIANKDKEGNPIMKPKLVVDYKNTMGGIDRLDQHRPKKRLYITEIVQSVAQEKTAKVKKLERKRDTGAMTATLGFV